MLLDGLVCDCVWESELSDRGGSAGGLGPPGRGTVWWQSLAIAKAQMDILDI